jgi:hypothetical protein
MNLPEHADAAAGLGCALAGHAQGSSESLLRMRNVPERVSSVNLLDGENDRDYC